MNYLLSFQFCLNSGNLCIYRDISSTIKVAVAAVWFWLVEISILQTFHYKGIKLAITISISFAALIILKTFILCWSYQ